MIGKITTESKGWFIKKYQQKFKKYLYLNNQQKRESSDVKTPKNKEDITFIYGKIAYCEEITEKICQ